MPADGNDLNPLLQDPGMVVHPPMLYMGYVGFSVAFAFAVAALLGGKLDATWARWTRPWTTAAWAFLTIGIMLGSMWAYYVLGWGGWWFWDPVENASFMPWLAGTALIHSLAVTEKRGAFKSWTVLLAILAFSLSLLGTFIVRSGVLSSVHAFATDPERGLFILVFLCIVIGGSLALYAWRAPKVGLGARFALVSRESMLLANNVLFVVAMLSVLLGTLYPLLLDALGLGKISVGPPYFDTVFVPLMAPMVFLMGVGPMARWKQAQVPDLAKRLRWAAVVAVVAALLSAWLAGGITFGATLGLLMCFWIVASVVTDLVERGRPQPAASRDGGHADRAPGRGGVRVGREHGQELRSRARPEDGQRRQHGARRLRLHLPRRAAVVGPNYDAMQGLVEVTRNGRPVATLRPEKRVYSVQQTPMTEAAINRGPTRDLYVSLGEPVDAGRAWIVRVYVKPFVDWIWGGCLLMAVGAALAATDRRYRAKQTQETTACPWMGCRHEEPALHHPARALRRALRVPVPRRSRSIRTSVRSPLIGKPAPSFALPRLDDANTRIARDDMLGKVWVLNVWASWCAACREEHPTLLAFSQTNAVPIIGLNYKDTRAEGLAWLQQFGNPYTASAFDNEGKVGIDFGVYGVPETFVIDKRGVVRFKQVGPLTPEIIESKILPAREETQWLSGSAQWRR